MSLPGFTAEASCSRPNSNYYLAYTYLGGAGQVRMAAICTDPPNTRSCGVRCYDPGREKCCDESSNTVCANSDTCCGAGCCPSGAECCDANNKVCCYTATSHCYEGKCYPGPLSKAAALEPKPRSRAATLVGGRRWW